MAGYNALNVVMRVRILLCEHFSELLIMSFTRLLIGRKSDSESDNTCSNRVE